MPTMTIMNLLWSWTSVNCSAIGCPEPAKKIAVFGSHSGYTGCLALSLTSQSRKRGSGPRVPQIKARLD